MTPSSDTWNTTLRKQIRECLFHPRTGLIYDYITSHDPRHGLDHLPAPEEIARSFPNPCGWSTGMEDCAINTGLLLCHLISVQEESSEWACALAEGLLSLERVHGRSGFIVRGILPADGASCYPNSSRDQLTIATYSLWKYSQAPETPAQLKEESIRLLCRVADYCAKTLSPQNHWDYRRLDGGPAVVSGLWQGDAHEMLRLPMIYGIAAHVSHQARYQELLQQFLPEGLKHTLSMDPNSPSWWDMPLLQMQLSLNFFKESKLVPDILTDIGKAMDMAGDIAQEKLAGLLDQAEDFQGNWTEPFCNWRTLPMIIRDETLTADGRSAVFGGLTYMNPIFKEEFARPHYLLRALGDYLATMAHRPSKAIPQHLIRRALSLLATLDLSHAASAATVPLLYGLNLPLHPSDNQGDENHD